MHRRICSLLSRAINPRALRRLRTPRISSAFTTHPNPAARVVPLAPSTKRNSLVIYDFDLSMANATSDTWLLEQLDMSLHAEFNDRIDAGFPCWVEEINEMFDQLHANGTHGDEIVDTITRIPVFDANLQMIKELGALGVKQMVVSDANMLYIDGFLKNHKLRHYFSEIYTNGADINNTGKFQVRRYLSEPHSCHWCDDAPNMCKGEIFERILMTVPMYEKVGFVCDGTNDYCGALRMRQSDTIFCRRDLGLHKMLKQFGVESVPPQVLFWSHGDELRELVLSSMN